MFTKVLMDLIPAKILYEIFPEIIFDIKGGSKFGVNWPSPKLYQQN